MNDILFSQNSKQQGEKNFDITKYNRTNRFSLPYHSVHSIHDWIFIEEIFFRGI